MNKIKFKNYILNFLTVIISTFLGLLIANIIFISVSTQNYFPRSLAGSLPNILLTFYPDTYNKDNLEDYVAITGDSYSQGGGDAYLNGIRDYTFAHHLHKNDNKNYLNFGRAGYGSISAVSNLIMINKLTYLPNLIETVESFLATVSIGAIWSSCSPDFGVNGVIERFAQIKPKVLILCDRYYYNGKQINVIDRLKPILKKIKSIKNVIIINYPGKKHIKFKKNKYVKFEFWKNIKKLKPKKLEFKRFDFNHELAILYSSGTTGKPKCICHRSGGVLLQHLKEHQLQSEIKENDNVFYFTTCGWMMWNWLISSLASKASIVLFEGFPMYKKNDLLIKIADRENITLFGVSAKYIDSLRKLNFSARLKYKLKKLKTICSTGSPLSEDGFNYIYEKIKKNVHLASISGGTDIVSCFVLGNIYRPVISGEIQSKGLGMDMDVFNDHAKSIKNKKGELVCKNPFPSMPIKFWNDKNNEKFKKAYFKKFKGVWHHGDYAEIKDSGGFIIYGRSDTTLNPGGVRLGTAEIYSVVEKFKEVQECLVVGQPWDNDVRIVLFLVMNRSYDLREKLIKKIKQKIRAEASPRHVPSKIIKVSDVPRTKNGKIVELKNCFLMPKNAFEYQDRKPRLRR